MDDTESFDISENKYTETESTSSLVEVLVLWERLSSAVIDYPVLYDKNHQDYQRKDIKDNAWKEVAKKLNLEENSAEKEWDKLRNRYTRVKRELKERTTCNSSLTSLRTAARKMDELQFLSWMDDHIKPRQSKSKQGFTMNFDRSKNFVESEVTVTRAAIVNNTIVNQTSTPNFNSKFVPSFTSSSREGKRKIVENEELNHFPIYIQKPKEVHSRVFESNREVESSPFCSNTSFRDEQEIFIELVAKKLSRMSEILSEYEMEDVQQSILSVIRTAKKNAKHKISN